MHMDIIAPEDFYTTQLITYCEVTFDTFSSPPLIVKKGLLRSTLFIHLFQISDILVIFNDSNIFVKIEFEVRL